MTKKVWLINLFGTPSAPSSFNPDNSLAALAGSLKAQNYSPYIIDFQTLDYCEKFIPSILGSRSLQLLDGLQESFSEKYDDVIREFKSLSKELEEHQLKMVDQAATELIEKALDEKPLFIGFKLYSGEGVNLTNHLVSRMKAKLSMPFVGGGPLIKVVGRDVMEHFPQFDYLIAGEADRAIVDFAHFCEGNLSKEKVRGLIYRERAEIIAVPRDYITNLDELPPPCYDKEVYPALYQDDQKAIVFQIDESRGCPNTCSFCTHPGMSQGRNVRCFSPERVADLIEDLQNKFGAYAFRFTGSNTPKQFLRRFANVVLERGLNIQYSCFTSVNMLKAADLPLLRQSGLCGLFIGIETLDDEMLKGPIGKKWQSKEKVKSIVQACIDNDIFLTTTWIYPFPGSTPEMRDEVRDFIISTYSGKGEVGSATAVPGWVVPGTAWFEHNKMFKIDIADKKKLIADYIKLVMRTFMPKTLMGEAGFGYNGKSFEELAEETDRLNQELSRHQILLSITDDWMLMGKMAGHGLQEFKDNSVRALIGGDIEDLKKMIRNIRINSYSKIPISTKAEKGTQSVVEAA